MSKISQLGTILSKDTASNDLFVTVNIAQGDNGTKNITRKELVRAIQLENFDKIKITGGTIRGTAISSSTMAGVNIRNSTITTTTISDSTFLTGNISNTTLQDVSITDSTLNTVNMSNSNIDVSAITESTFENGVISNTILDNFIIGDLNLYTAPLVDTDEFILKEASTGRTVKLNVASFNEEISEQFKKTNKVYVAADAKIAGNGSYMRPYQTLEQAFAFINSVNIPISISVMPGNYYTEGNLSLPDKCSIVSTNGQYATNIYLYDPNNGPGSDWYLYDPIEENCFLVGSGCYVQGFAFRNMRVDSFDNPSKGFAVAFRPGATILRSPYIRDCSQVSNYNSNSVAAPLDPTNANPLVGRGGGMILVDRAVLNNDTIFPYMLAFGATPRSPNGIGYVAKNGAGINGISSVTIFQRCAFYALNGGQITLNNSGTQFGDISMRSNGSTNVVDPYELIGTDKQALIQANEFAEVINTNRESIINEMWDDINRTYVVGLNTVVNEALTRRDANNFIQSIYYDLVSAGQISSRNFAASFFDYKGDHVFSVFNPPALYSNTVYAGSRDSIENLPLANTVSTNAAYIVYDPVPTLVNIYSGDIYISDGTTWINVGVNDNELLRAFIFGFERMRVYMKELTTDPSEELMINSLTDLIIRTLTNPQRLIFGSLIESLAHQFNLAGAGVNKNALPLNFRRVGKPLPASGSVLKENKGRVRWSGADELNNQYFSGGLKINGRTGRLEGRPFTSAVRRLARRAANSRVST